MYLLTINRGKDILEVLINKENLKTNYNKKTKVIIIIDIKNKILYFSKPY